MALPSDLDLQCFQKRMNPGSAGQGLIKKKVIFRQGDRAIDFDFFASTKSKVRQQKAQERLHPVVIFLRLSD